MENKKLWTVWVGGGEVNDELLTYDEAKALADKYVSDGYDDVEVSKYTETKRVRINLDIFVEVSQGSDTETIIDCVKAQMIEDGLGEYINSDNLVGIE